MISVIHPSRQRPERAKQTYDNWQSKKSGKYEVEWVLSIDTDEPRLTEYVSQFKMLMVYSFMPNHSAIEAINNAMALTNPRYKILIVVSDDFDCPENWDELIVQAAAGKTDWIMKTQDGTQGWIITLPIMDRTYYERFGYIYHPEYLHMFCDTEMSCVADLLGKRITTDLVFPHNHYSTGKSQKDAVSEKADATWAQGEKLFIERAKSNFGIDNPVGKISDKGMINWLKARV